MNVTILASLSYLSLIDFWKEDLHFVSFKNKYIYKASSSSKFERNREKERERERKRERKKVSCIDYRNMSTNYKVAQVLGCSISKAITWQPISFGKARRS